MWNNQQTTKKNVFLYVKLTILLYFKVDLKKMDQHTGGKWLNHGTKRGKDN